MFKLMNMFGVFAANVAAATEKVSQDVSIDFSRLPGTLKHMGIGMLSIFIVIGVIILSVYALNSLTAKFSKFKEARAKAQAEAQARFDAEQENK